MSRRSALRRRVTAALAMAWLSSGVAASCLLTSDFDHLSDTWGRGGGGAGPTPEGGPEAGPDTGAPDTEAPETGADTGPETGPVEDCCLGAGCDPATGRCSPTLLEPDTAAVVTAIALDPTWIVWTDSTRLRVKRLPRDAGPGAVPEIVADVSGADAGTHLGPLAVRDGDAYFTVDDGVTTTLMRAPLAGGPVVSLGTATGSPGGSEGSGALVVDGQRAYALLLVSGYEATVHAFALDGGVTPLYGPSLNGDRGLVLDEADPSGSALYWLANPHDGDGGVVTMGKDGKAPHRVVNGQANPARLALRGGALYLTNGDADGGNTVVGAALDGGFAVLHEPEPGAAHIALAGGELIWIDTGNGGPGAVRLAALAGGAPVTLHQDQPGSYPHALAAEPGVAYFFAGTSRLLRMGTCTCTP